jgi:MOSC domain-containing protein YiiM
MPAIVISVNIGTAQPLEGRGRTVLSGIFKRAVSGPVMLTRIGLSGDEQLDRQYHGGADKAVNVYAQEHLITWGESLGRPLEPGAFGENFTTQGLLEDTVCIGDTYQIGGAVVQVTQPRQPCWKLASKHREPQLVRWVIESGTSGFYLRCLTSGPVRAGDSIELVGQSATRVTVSEANKIMYDVRSDASEILRLLSVAELSDAWRGELTGRCNRS